MISAQTMDWTGLNEFLSSLKWAIAGFFGALISARFHKEEIMNRGDYFMFLISGVLIAHYMTGIVARYLDFGAETAGGIGFLLGAFGGSLIQAVIRAIRTADLWAIIKARFGGGS